ncbi:MFS transporter [Dyadobacter luteus]|uniref:MFS transporter n=2 Tax=Dyadobacter luteus TaxID=2259619 RepID=A0A3D8YIC8_9BACT|nr:MFS transporter [Dyadobacter luteus]
MEAHNIFKSWVPDWLIKSVLLVCMLHSMVLLGLYSSNVSYSVSFLDIDPEDLQYSMSITYGTFLATILIEGRMFRYFPTRNYFIAIYLLAALTFIISAYTHHFMVFLMLRIVEGFLMALPWIPLRILLLTRFKSRNATIIVFSFTYGMLLMASPFITNIAVWLLENYDWNYMAYGSAFFQLTCAMLVLIVFNGSHFHRKIPLFQVDWASFVMILTAILCGAFVLVYGEKKYWLQSSEIVLAIMITAITSSLFIIRQLSVTRPSFDFEVFRFSNLRTGLLLFLLLYISRSTLNICHNTMASVWNWEVIRIAHVQYLNVAGNFVGMLIAGFLLSRSVAPRYLFITAFAILSVHHLWFTFLFVPDVSLNDIAIPYLLQGVGVGIIFVPLVLFTVSSVPARLAPFAGTVGVIGRFWGNTLGFCVLQNAQFFLYQKHENKLKQFITQESTETQLRITNATVKWIDKGFTGEESRLLSIRHLAESTHKQAILLSNMEIYTFMGYGLVFIVIMLILNQHLKQTFDIFKNRIWGT